MRAIALSVSSLAVTCAAWAAPSIEVNPANVHFSPPEYMVGLGSQETKVIIANVGTDPLHLTSIAIRGTARADFTLSGGGCPPVLQPQERCEKFVGFRPRQPGLRSANLVAVSDDPQRPELLVPLGGAGALPAPRLTVSNDELDFGTEQINVAGASRYVLATNIGMQTLTFAQISINPAGEFSLVPPSDCGSLDLASSSSGLSPSSCYVYVTFKPSSPGLRAATLTFTSNDPNGPATVALLGMGAAATIAVDEAAFDLGTAVIGDPALGKTRRSIPVKNQGAADLTVTSASITGVNELDFHVLAGVPCTVDPSGSSSCPISIEFLPRGLGQRSATLSLASNDPHNPNLVLTLQGFAEVVYPPPPAVGPQNRVNLEPATDRIGADYAAFVASEGECRRRCRTDPQCKAFTFRPAAPWCWLKNQPQTPTTDARYVSGMKGASPDLAIVTVNMAGHATFPDTSVSGGADWRVRADRLADAVANLGPDRRPDVISLTEVEGWRWCSPGTGDTVGDYDMIARLVERLTARTGVPYRIAYMVGNRGAFGLFAQCRYFSGDVVLYNPERLSNRNLDDAPDISPTPHDAGTLGLQRRYSLPFCNPGSAPSTIRDRIDGAPQSSNCGSVPSGPAWTWIFSAPEMTSPVTAIRFSFRHDPRSTFDFFTVHPMAGREDASLAFAIAPFINTVTQGPLRTDRPLYPPILVGDLNSLAGAPDSIPRFIQVAGAELMAVRRGLDFNSVHDYRAVERIALPADPSGFFSDHPGLFVQLAWVDPHDAVAGRLAPYDDGTVVAEEQGGLWVIVGGARFHIPDPTTHARLFDGKTSLTVQSGELTNVGQVPLTGTLLREDNGAIWVVAGGAKFHVPDLPTYARLYAGGNLVQLWDGSVSTISDTPADGTLLREDNGAIWVILGGAKFHVPDPPTFARLFPDGRPFQLWTGALSAISDLPADGTLLREESSSEVFEIRNGHKQLVNVGPTADVRVLWDGALAQIP